MSIFKDTFKPEIQGQLKARQDAIFERTPEAIQYFNARNSWIRMSSAVNVAPSLGSPPTNELAKKYILQGGTLYENQLRSGVSTQNAAYSILSPGGNPNRLGLRPMPGITGIDIKSLSAYGSLREVVVKFNAWDIRQLEDLELLYMRPGYTALIEWGWAPYLDNNKKLQNNIDFTQNDIINKLPTKEQLFKNIYDTAVKTYNGNYDAMFGYVKNYSWSAREDGGYDCSTTIVSVGEVIESLKVNYAPFNNIDQIIGGGGLIGTDNDTDELKEAYSKNILAGLFYEIWNIGKEKEDKEVFLIPDTKKGSSYDGFRKKINIAGGSGDSSTPDEVGSSDVQVYITLESLCNLINNYVTVIDSNSKQAYIKCSVFDREYDKEIPFANGNGPIAPSINPTEFFLGIPSTTNTTDLEKYLLCLAHPLQISMDPSVCAINASFWTSGQLPEVGVVEELNSAVDENIVIYDNTVDDATYNNLIKEIETTLSTTNINVITGTNTAAVITTNTVNENKIISLLSSTLKGDPNKVKELSRRWHEKYPTTITTTSATTVTTGFNTAAPSTTGVTSVASNSLYSKLNKVLNSSQIDQALGGKNLSGAFYQNPAISEKQKLESQKKETIKQQTKVLSESDNISYLENLKPYFYQGKPETEMGIIGNIYVNVNFLFRLSLNDNLESRDTKEKNDINLYDFLKQVMSSISSAIGSVNNFDIHIDPIDSIPRIIDINYIDKKERNKVFKDAFTLEIHNTKSTVRSYKLESQIFPDQSATIAIGAQVGGGAMATDNNTMLDFNKGLEDRIIPKKLDPTTDPNKDAASNVTNQLVNLSSILDIFYGFFQRLGETSILGIKIEDSDFNTEKSGQYQNALRDLINFYKNLTKSNIKNRAIIPTKLSITMDGIGGLVIGHIFKIPEELLPKGYKGDALGSKLGHIVTSIGHSVNNTGDWTTNIDAQTIILDDPSGGDLKFTDIVKKDKKYKDEVEKRKSSGQGKNYGGAQVPNSIVLHHTVGYGTAQATVDYLPTVGLSIHYAVGADGKVVQGLDEKLIGYHANQKNLNSIGIEICTIGGLTLKNGKYIDVYGKEFKNTPTSPVIDLGYSFNDYRYYADLTDIQATALLNLLKGIIQRNPGITLNFTKTVESIYKNVFGLPGIPERNKSYTSVKLNGGTTGKDPGIFIHALAKGGTHTDTFPSPKMLEILKKLT